jgi:DNA invertase Pin-like site-specific DNA recombinase
MDKMIVTILGMVAEMEVGFIRERQLAGAAMVATATGIAMTAAPARVMGVAEERNVALARNLVGCVGGPSVAR